MSVFLLLFVLVSICAFVTISSSYHWGLKSLLIIGIVLSSLVSFQMLKDYRGYPVAVSRLSSEVVVYGQVIDKDNDKIYILKTEIGEELPAKYCVLPYSKGMHKALEEGEEKYGSEFVLTTEEEGDGEDGGKGDKKDGDPGEGAENLSLESKTYGVKPRFPHKMPKKEANYHILDRD